MDEDIEQMSREQLVTEAKRLRHGIRQHRDSTEHELCWHHPALWGLLPQETDPLPTVPAWPQFMQGCIRYRQSLDAQLPNAPRTTRSFDDSTDLFEVERSLWTNNADIYQESLREDALLLFQETGVITRDTAVAAIRGENRQNRRWAEVNFSDQTTLRPTDDTRVLIYTATARWNDEQNPITVLCSSVYALSRGNWKLIFHQQTPAAA